MAAKRRRCAKKCSSKCAVKSVKRHRRKRSAGKK